MASVEFVLEQYRNGERAPVQGPLTYEETLALVIINQRLIQALHDQTALNTQHSTRIGTRVHYAACAVLADAEALMGATDARRALSGSQS